MASIADLFFTFRGDDRQLRLDASKAGEGAGQTLGQRMSSGMKTTFKAGLVGVGAAGGALFGVAAKGGAELTETIAKYRAETGATAAEAEAAQASIGKLYRNNTAGFATLGDVLTRVHNDLGLTGEAAETAAQKVLDYAKVTGQDAVAAVGTLDDLTDTFNLTSAEQADVLDKLVVSHQRYGGSVESNQQALIDLAPALRAANLSYDDGIGLLNLFEKSGIDAAAAPAALTKALQKVKSPAELQRLIADIQATQDPFERATKASDLFGAKAGVKLAAALAAGTGGLGEFAISADEAGGAVEKASDVIDASPYNQLQLALRKVTGGLAELGTKFGPVVLGFSQLGGPKLIGGLTAGLGAIVGKVLPGIAPALAGIIPAVTGVLATIGSAMGGIIAAAIPIGMALLPVILVAALVAAIVFLVNNPEIVGQILEFVGGILSTIAGALAALPRIFADVAGKAVGAIAQAAGRIVGFITAIPGKVASWVGQIAGQAAKLASSVGAGIRKLVGDVISFFLGIPGRLVDVGASIVRTIVEGLVSLPGKLWDAVVGAFRSILPITLGPITIGLHSINFDLGPISETLATFAKGTPFVPHDMLAMVHAGEMIIPAAESDAIRAGRAALATTSAQGTAPTARTLTVNVYNPTPEPASTSTKRELQKVMVFGGSA